MALRGPPHRSENVMSAFHQKVDINLHGSLTAGMRTDES